MGHKDHHALSILRGQTTSLDFLVINLPVLFKVANQPSKPSATVCESVQTLTSGSHSSAQCVAPWEGFPLPRHFRATLERD